MAAFVCRICEVSVPRHRAVRLFSTKAAMERLSLRISDLLDVPVPVNDGHSEYICKRCKQKFDHLERAAEELEEFRCQANQTYDELGLRKGDLKRIKETSAAVGVSPDTTKNRPPSKKLSRRHLNFQQSKYMEYLLDKNIV